MLKFKKLGGEAESFLAFPILVALSRRPMRQRELSHALQLSLSTTKLRLKELAKAGYIAKRAEDNRWIPVVSLQMGGLPQPTGVPGIHPPSPPELGPPREQNIVPYVTPPTPQEIEEAAKVPPPPVVTPSSPPEPPAVKLARHFAVPARIRGRGALSVGSVVGCALCGKHTPLKYGGSPTCKECARILSSVDRVGENEQTL